MEMLMIDETNVEEACTRTYSNNGISNGDDSNEEQQLALGKIRQWITASANFYGRTDDEFVLTFLHGCKFDVEKTKAKIAKYYDIRIKYHYWWSNRNLKDPIIESIIRLNILTFLQNEDKDQPLVLIATMSRVPNSLEMFDHVVKTMTTYIDIGMRESRSRENGAIVIVNCHNIPKHPVRRAFTPSFMKLISNLYGAVPIKIKSMNFVNVSPVITAFHKLMKPFMRKKMLERFHFYGNDWTLLNDHVPFELLPEEYKGGNGPMKYHEDECVQKMLSQADFIMDDNRYGQRK